MIFYLMFVGAVAFIFGSLFLFSPQTIRNLSDKVNKTVATIDEKLYSLRVGTGVSLILVSFLAFFTVYYLVKKYSIF